MSTLFFLPELQQLKTYSMKQVKCPDCEAEYPAYLKSCPHCGCPNDHWAEQDKEATASESNYTATSGKNDEEAKAEVPHGPEEPASTSNGKEVKTDWANYVYECGLLFWHCFSRRYFKAKGRASRREFWSFLVVLNVLLGGPVIYSQVVDSDQSFLNPYPGPMFTPGEYLILLVCLIPLITVWIRRMHDIGKSGWWCLVPYADFFLALKKSDEGENKYGEPAIDDI